MRIKKHTLLVGLRDKDTKTYLMGKQKALNIIMNIVGDCTVSDATGKYSHEDGTEVKEKCFRVELLFKKDKEVIGYCQKIKKELNQESVALSVSYENSTLI